MRGGIDFGGGRTNVNRETGIRFGVISQHELKCWWSDSFENYYGEPTCPECGSRARKATEPRPGHAPGQERDEEEDEEWEPYTEHGCADFECDLCHHTLDQEQVFSQEALGATLDNGKYKGEWHTDGDIFVKRSAYYTFARFCSPCCPGAGTLTSPLGIEDYQVGDVCRPEDRDGPRFYCFGEEWFDEDRPCPYLIFRVIDDVCIYRPKESEAS